MMEQEAEILLQVIMEQVLQEKHMIVVLLNIIIAETKNLENLQVEDQTIVEEGGHMTIVVNHLHQDQVMMVEVVDQVQEGHTIVAAAVDLHQGAQVQEGPMIVAAAVDLHQVAVAVPLRREVAVEDQAQEVAQEEETNNKINIKSIFRIFY
jgi:hypothetical protein